MRTGITALVLSQIAALGACKAASNPPTDGASPTTSATTAATTPVPSASASASVAPATSVSASPSASASAIVSADAGPKDLLGMPCTRDGECGPKLRCMQDTKLDGTKEASGICVGRPPPTRGRALFVDGIPRVADVDRLAPGDAVFSDRALADKLRRDALEEHASIAAFARTICELVALGAPADLLAATARALDDEVRHTADTIAWAERVTGERWTIAPLPAAVAPLRSGPSAPGQLLRDVFRGGAIGETLAAAAAADEAERGPVEMRAFYRKIADDEARHAALAFVTLRWLLGRFPEVHEVYADERARFFAGATAETRSLVGPLFDAV